MRCRGRPLAAPRPCYQQPCPPPSPLAPLKFTHLIGARACPGSAVMPLCPAAEGRLPPGLASARRPCGGTRAGRRTRSSDTEGPSLCTHKIAGGAARPSRRTPPAPSLQDPVPSSLPADESASGSYSMSGGHVRPPPPSPPVPDRFPRQLMPPVTPSANVY